MKRRFNFLCILMITVLLLSNMEVAAVTNTDINEQLEIVVPDVDPPQSSEEVYNRIIAWEEKIPTGTPWNNESPYGINGYLGYSYSYKGRSEGGNGCAAFAFLLSDVAFGDLPAIQYTDVQFEDIRIGDILRINEDKHSVIVLQITSDSITIAEANVNGGKVRWGKVMTKTDVMEKITYLETRYPDRVAAGDTDTMDSTTTYTYAHEQKEDKGYRYLYDSDGNLVDMFNIKSGVLIYKGKKIKKIKKIKWADFNEVGNIIIILKNTDYYSVNKDLEIKKLGTKAMLRHRKNNIVTHIIKKSGKKVNVSKK